MKPSCRGAFGDGWTRILLITMTGNDAELVALIDNELDEEAKGHLLARLAEDEELSKRHEALREAGARSRRYSMR